MPILGVAPLELGLCHRSEVVLEGSGALLVVNRRRKAELVGLPAAPVEDPEDVEVAVSAGKPVVTGVVVLRGRFLAAGVFEGRLGSVRRSAFADDAHGQV